VGKEGFASEGRGFGSPLIQLVLFIKLPFFTIEWRIWVLRM
jgi:hypothetical protein